MDEIYSQFGEDLKNSIEDLANEGKVTTKNILKNAARHEFLPTDYVNDSRINEVKDGLIRLMLDNEANIDNGRVVPVKDAMEKIYRRLFRVSEHMVRRRCYPLHSLIRSLRRMISMLCLVHRQMTDGMKLCRR